MNNLFGEEVSDLIKTWEQKYKDHLASAKWKRKREAVLDRAGYKCEICGNTKWISPLEVHHKTYINFGEEKLDELLVVCRKCHKLEDEKRWREMQENAKQRRIRRIENRWYARLDGWATKVWGDHWWDYVSDEFAQYKFLEFLRRHSE